MVLVCTAFGLYGPSFFPEKAGRDYEPSEYMKVLGDLRDDVTVFSGISHPEIGGDHASEGCFLTGAKHPTGSLITYATGAAAGPADFKAIGAVVKSAAADGYGLRSILHGVIQSDLFRSK